MNTARVFSLSIVLLHLMPFLVLGEDQRIVDGEMGKAISDYVTTVNERFRFYGSVLVARDGKVIAAISSGKSFDPKRADLEPTTLFEIASISKSLTAIGVMTLHQQGKLNIDDPITKLLPEVPDNCKEITIRHLLQHSSGIPKTNRTGRSDDFAKLAPLIFKGGPKTEPGIQHEYWNGGYAVLSEIIARASGKSYVEYMRDSVFFPSGMKSTGFTGDAAPKGVSVATGFSTRGPRRSALDHPYGSYDFRYRGMGGVVTNIWDLWRLDRALVSGKLLSEKNRELMRSNPLSGYALGWRVDERSGNTVQHHSGRVPGFLANFRRYPAKDGVVIVLANTDISLGFNFVVKGTEEIFFGQNPRLPESLSADIAKNVLGFFSDPAHGTIKLVRSGKDIRVVVRKKSGYSFSGFLEKKKGGKIELNYGKEKGIPIQLEPADGTQVQTLIMMNRKYPRVVGK